MSPDACRPQEGTEYGGRRKLSPGRRGPLDQLNGVLVSLSQTPVWMEGDSSSSPCLCYLRSIQSGAVDSKGSGGSDLHSWKPDPEQQGLYRGLGLGHPQGPELLKAENRKGLFEFLDSYHITSKITFSNIGGGGERQKSR